MIPIAGDNIHHILILGDYKINAPRSNYYNANDKETLTKYADLAMNNHIKPKKRKIVINTNNYSQIEKRHMLCIDALIFSKKYTGSKNKLLETIKYRLGHNIYNIVKNNVGLCDIYVDFINGVYVLGL